VTVATARLTARRRIARIPRSIEVVVGGIGVAAILALVIVGPWVSPYSPNDLVYLPYSPPTKDYLLGTDYVGRDVLSRILHGGRSVVLLALIATVLAYLMGGTIGLTAGFVRGKVDAVLMRTIDVLLAFPHMLFILLLATGVGSSPALVVFGIAVIQTPHISRVIRAATLQLAGRGFVEAAVARGEATHRILRREIVPNIVSVLVADGGPRFTFSILMVAALNFLGVGLRPPAADWAVMISENRPGLEANLWGVLAPAILIAILAVSINLVTDAIARSRGRPVEDPAGQDPA
jgi:ABC-type dipeptide/oligopeptide/nickel transport system permease subunit